MPSLPVREVSFSVNPLAFSIARENSCGNPNFKLHALDIPLVRHYNGSMAFVRTKRIKNRTYYYLVESKREGNKVKQKVIKYLGAQMPTKEQIETMRRER